MPGFINALCTNRERRVRYYTTPQVLGRFKNIPATLESTRSFTANTPPRTPAPLSLIAVQMQFIYINRLPSSVEMHRKSTAFALFEDEDAAKLHRESCFIYIEIVDINSRCILDNRLREKPHIIGAQKTVREERRHNSKSKSPSRLIEAARWTTMMVNCSNGDWC